MCSRGVQHSYKKDRMTREDAMKAQAESEAEEAGSPMDKLRALILTRGYQGILQFGGLFRRTDDDDSHTLNKEELAETIGQFGLSMSEDEISELCAEFDEDGTGSIDYNEFLDKLRPEMTEPRIEIVEQAYAVLDEAGDGVVTIDDIRDKYSAANHPRVLSGESSEDEILAKFLSRFDGGVKEDGKLTKQEFLDYYSGLSKSIDDDEYFVEVIKTCWKL
ncbi:hypothetical protein SK128_017648 [Halocaridina rubra]|uniref:EF-hand domain-containing protein n=1 Tax=Halocaridina rubra TaxID=373956 RepID=A0AAN9A5H5_HALRR